MAGKVNTKLVLVILGVLLMAGAGVGYLGLKVYQGDAQRNIAAGDQLMAEGDYRGAKSMYGRAVNKAPADPEFAAKYREALTSITPRTQEEARALYEELLKINAQFARARRNNAEAHLINLRELEFRAEVLRNTGAWQRVVDAAEDMAQNVLDADPQSIEARYYRGRGIMQQVSSLELEDIQSGEADLRAYLEAQPDSDRGWTALLRGTIARYEMARRAGRLTQTDELRNKVESIFAEAPKGVGVTNLRAAWLQARRGEDPEATDAEAPTRLALEALELAEQSGDPGDLIDIADTILLLAREEGLTRLTDAFQTHVDANPNDLLHAYYLARLAYVNRELDRTLNVVDNIVESENLPVGLMSAFQPDLRKYAVTLAADVHFRRWQLAETEAERRAHLEDLEAARDRVAEYATDQSTDIELMKVEGQLALAGGDENTAVIKLEKYIENATGLGSDVDMLIYAAQALEATGRPGMALRRYETAVKYQPSRPILWEQKARLEMDMNRLEQADRSLTTLAAIDPESASLPDLRSRYLVMQRQATGAVDSGDAVGDAIVDAREMLERGDYDEARSTIAFELSRNPGRIPLLITASQIEFAAGDKDASLGYIRQARELQPENPRLDLIEKSLTTDDPVEMFRTFLEATEDNVQRRTVALAVGLSQFVDRETQRAERLEARGEAGAANTVRDQLADLRTAADDAMNEAREIAPQHPVLLDFELGEAIKAKDWAAGGAVVDRAAAADADGARGLLFRGRLLLAQGETQAAVQALDEATQTLHYSAAAWRLLADANQQLGRLQAAEEAFSRAYECNPNDAMTVRAYAALLEQLGEPQRALPILSQAARALRNDVPLREQWLRLERRVGLLSTVLRERRAIYDRRDPETYVENEGDRRNAMALASVLGAAQPSRENVLDADGRLKYDASRWSRLSATQQDRELAETRADWRAESDEILADLAAKAGPDHQFDLALLEADILRQRGEFAAGESVLRSYLEDRAGPDDQGEVMLALGRFQADAGRGAEAVRTFEAAREHQGEDMLADLELARVYAAGREFDLAAIHYDRVLESVSDPEVGAQRVECAVMLGDFDAAERLLAAQVQEHGDSTIFAMIEASIHGGRAGEAYAADDLAAATRQRELQQAALDRAAALSPRDPMPHVQRARARIDMYEQSGDALLLDDAMDAVSEATRLDASFIPARLARADIHIYRGDIDAATSELERVLEDAPYSDELRRRLVSVLISRNRLAAAVDLVEDAVELYPSDPAWLELLGELYVLQNDRRAALESFRKAFGIEPIRSTLIKIAVLMLEEENPKYSDIVSFIEARPDDLDEDPMVRAIYARAILGTGLRDQAIDQMARSYEGFRAAIRSGQQQPAVIRDWFRVAAAMFPAERPAELERFVMDLTSRRPDAYELEQLAAAWVVSGRTGLSRAIELQREAVAAAPVGDAELRAALYQALGVYLVTEGDAEGAAAAFAEVVRLRPDDPDANNNYAYVLADRLGRPADALPYAEQAVALSPRDANLLDTLGMILFQVGRAEEAEARLRESINIQPLAAAHVHLAEVLLARGDKDAARTYLQRAEELRPNTRTREEIRRLSSELTR